MKRIFLSLLISFVGISGIYAQKSKINEAAKALEKAQGLLALQKPDAAAEPLNEAKAAIDAAVADASTKDNAKAWYTKSAVYMAMQEVSTLSSGNPYKEAITALKKATTLDKKIANDDQFPNVLANGAFYSYNDGVNAMNGSHYSESYDLFSQAAELLSWDNNRFFKDNKQVDTIKSKTQLFEGYSAFYDKKYDVAVPLLKAASKDAITGSETNIYLLLAKAYQQQGDSKSELAIIEEGKKKFPNDKNITAAELNYYFAAGKQSEMITKLNDAIAKDPNNAALYYNLGIVYKDLAKLDDEPTAQTDDYFKKAETAYQKAVSLDASNLAYEFELGALYYNKGVFYNKKMMSLGTDAVSLKKSNELKTLRDQYFTQATTHLEKARTLFRSNKSALQPDQLKDYEGCLNALSAIYVNLDQEDKAKSVEDELKGL
jgi:predicted Zn-dependent protease